MLQDGSASITLKVLQDPWRFAPDNARPVQEYLAYEKTLTPRKLPHAYA